MNHLQNEKGVSLIMTLLLLLVVGLLIGAFMNSSVFNIRFSQDQLDQKRAFYAAEAGIQHLDNIGISLSDDDFGGNTEPVLSDEVGNEDYDGEYDVYLVDDSLNIKINEDNEDNEILIEDVFDAGDEIEFRSEGKYSEAWEDIIVVFDIIDPLAPVESGLMIARGMEISTNEPPEGDLFVEDFIDPANDEYIFDIQLNSIDQSYFDEIDQINLSPQWETEDGEIRGISEEERQDFIEYLEEGLDIDDIEEIVPDGINHTFDRDRTIDTIKETIIEDVFNKYDDGFDDEEYGYDNGGSMTGNDIYTIDSEEKDMKVVSEIDLTGNSGLEIESGQKDERIDILVKDGLNIQSELNVDGSGEVHFWIKEEFDLDGNADFGDSNVIINAHKDMSDFSFEGNLDGQALFFGPETEFEFEGAGDGIFKGSFIGDYIDAGANANLEYAPGVYDFIDDPGQYKGIGDEYIWHGPNI